MLARYLCGVREAVTVPGGLAAWPHKEITYTETLIFQGLSRAQVEATYDLAAAQISAVCGLDMRRADPNGIVNIVAGVGTIDGPYGVLALSEFPYTAELTTTLYQEFDFAEPWALQDISLLLSVMCHELCHAVGLVHVAGVGALMDPYITAGISAPQANDIAELQLRYGPPTVAAPILVDDLVAALEGILGGATT